MAPVNRCVRCNCPIDDSNDSEEHIIQNSVGGRLTVKGFICRACNNRTGETWDAVFAKQTNFLSHFFGIVRERGEIPPQPIVTTAGERLVLQPDGGFKAEKPIFQATPTENGQQIQIKARDRREAEAILRGVARKNPKVDVAAELAKAEEEHTYLEGMVTHTIQFDGPTSGRSAVKAAVAFAFHSGISIEQCDLSVTYLRDEVAEPAFGYYLERDLVGGRPLGVPIHCVAVSGDPQTGMLLGYIEYFSIHRIVVCHSQCYTGPAITRSYGLDPTSGRAIPVEVDLSFSAADIQAIYKYERIPAGAIERVFAEVAPAALKRNQDRAIAHEAERATKYALENCGAVPGEMLTAEHLKKIAALATEKMMPFIRHHGRRR